MSILLYLFFLGENGFPKIRLADHGFTLPFLIDCRKVGNHYLVTGSGENLMCLFNEAGEPIARYKPDTAKDPALSIPRVMGVKADEIIVVFGNGKVVAFDLSLKPKPTRYPPMSHPIQSGIYLGNNHFGLNTYPQGSHGLTFISLTEDTWRLDGNLFPMTFEAVTQEGLPPTPTFIFMTNRKKAFRWHSPRMGDAHYQVAVFETTAKKKEQVMVLQGELGSATKAENHHPQVLFASGFDGGFVVAAGTADRERFVPISRWADTFSRQGDFERRRELNLAVTLCPLGGTDHLLTLNQETLVLRVFE